MNIDRQGRFRLFLRNQSVWIAALSLCSGVALACEDPTLHPGKAEFTALVESLRSQPRSLVSLRYKIDDERGAFSPLSVRLLFWPNEPYERGRFIVTPSNGVKLIDFSGSEKIPYKGSFEFTVLPTRSGYHHLKVETIVEKAGEEKRHTAALALRVGLNHSKVPGQSETTRFGFAGSRLKEMLMKNQGAETKTDSPGIQTIKGDLK
ncbi:MAG: hypothetical protein MI754_11585 [Chromatiales bacterium]|nr:hypothetical protein [Chromatiales bacterium]